MPLGAPCRGLSPAQYLAVQTMGKHIKRRLRSVRQFIVPSRVEEMQPASQLLILILDVLQIAVQRRRSRPRGEDDTDQTRSFEQALVSWVQPVNLHLDHLGKCRG